MATASQKVTPGTRLDLEQRIEAKRAEVVALHEEIDKNNRTSRSGTAR